MNERTTRTERHRAALLTAMVGVLVVCVCVCHQVDVAGGKKAVVVFVPVKQLKQFRKVQVCLCVWKKGWVEDWENANAIRGFGIAVLPTEQLVWDRIGAIVLFFFEVDGFHQR